ASGPHPVGWLLLWLALALAGWLYQTSRVAKKPLESRTAHGRPGHEG
ncbi:MAG: hypothetical protein RIT24_849, partial [Planctomycetota bacterium]